MARAIEVPAKEIETFLSTRGFKRTVAGSEVVFRATNREDAKHQIRDTYPFAKFYR